MATHQTAHGITTDRLLLRRWRPGDAEPFARLNADPRVMEHFPSMSTREESDQLIRRIEDHFDQYGFGLWAVEVPGLADFIGFVGLRIPPWDASFTPCVEVGWRLSAEFWGRGYATEAARAALEFGFRSLNLTEIVSFTVPGNVRSRRVMERLGMMHVPELDFDHPMVAPGHPLVRHVFYRIRRDSETLKTQL